MTLESLTSLAGKIQTAADIGDSETARMLFHDMANMAAELIWGKPLEPWQLDIARRLAEAGRVDAPIPPNGKSRLMLTPIAPEKRRGLDALIPTGEIAGKGIGAIIIDDIETPAEAAAGIAECI